MGNVKPRLVAHEVGSELQFAVFRLLERESGLQLVAIAAEGRVHRHQTRLAVVHQGSHVLFRKVFLFHTELFQFLPVHIAVRYQVRSLRLRLRLPVLCRFLSLYRLRFRCLRLLFLILLFHFFHFLIRFLFHIIFFRIFSFRLLRSLLFLSLLVRRCIHFVRCEQFSVRLRVFQQVLDNRKQCFHRVRCHPVETESCRLLALAVEVPEEIVYHVSVAVKAQKLLRVFRLCLCPLGIASGIQSGNHTDFARLLVTDDQHVLFFFLFLFHFCLLFSVRFSFLRVYPGCIRFFRCPVPEYLLHMGGDEHLHVRPPVIGLVAVHPVWEQSVAAVALQGALAHMEQHAHVLIVHRIVLQHVRQGRLLLFVLLHGSEHFLLPVKAAEHLPHAVLEGLSV